MQKLHILRHLQVTTMQNDVIECIELGVAIRFTPPKLTGDQRDALSGPVAGLVIYNTTTNKLNVYTGSGWEAVTSE